MSYRVKKAWEWSEVMKIQRHRSKVKILILTLLVSVFMTSPCLATNVTWYSSSYTQKIPITITYSGTDDISDYYQVNFTLDGVNYTLTGLRIVDSDNQTLVPFWNETDLDTNAKIWANVTGITNTTQKTIWAYVNGSGNWKNPYKVFNSFFNYSENNQSVWDVYSPNLVANGYKWGSVVKFNSTSYYMFLSGSDDIYRFTSSDGKNWSLDPSTAVLTRTSGSWDSRQVWCPMVWIENETWYMLYSGENSTTGQISVGLATSTDGLSWTKYSGNPVWHDAAAWTGNETEGYGIIKYEGIYYLWYGRVTTERKYGVATSTDLKNWTADPENPIFIGDRFCPDVFYFNNTFYIIIPHYSSGSDYVRFELYSSPTPTFHRSEREFVKVVKYVRTNYFDDLDEDTPWVLTNDISRTLNQTDELWVYYATYNSSLSSWNTGLMIEKNITLALSDNLEIVKNAGAGNETINNSWLDVLWYGRGDNWHGVEDEHIFDPINNYRVEVEVRFSQDAGYGRIILFLRNNSSIQQAFYIGDYKDTSDSGRVELLEGGNLDFEENPPSGSSSLYASGDLSKYYDYNGIFSLCRYGNNLKFTDNDGILYDGTTTLPTEVNRIRVGIQSFSSYSSITTAEVNYFFISRYVEPEPSISIGSTHYGGDTRPALNQLTLIGTNSLCDYGTVNPATKVNMTVTPTTDIVEVNVTEFNSTLVNFTANSTTGNNVTFTIGNLTPSTGYTIQRNEDSYYFNGTGWQVAETTVQTNSTGYLTFWNDQWSTVTFVITESGVAPPQVVSSSPSSPVYNTVGDTRTFSASFDQVVNVTWQINGTTVQTNNSVTSASYTNTSAELGTWNVSAIASNPNGTVMVTWDWYVGTTPAITTKWNNITNDDSNEIYVNASLLNKTVEFSATANQVCNWSWTGIDSFTGNGTTQSNATKEYTAVGNYTISVYGKNVNGTTPVVTWDVYVHYMGDLIANNTTNVVLTNGKVSYGLTQPTEFVNMSVLPASVKVNVTVVTFTIGNNSTLIEFRADTIDGSDVTFTIWGLTPNTMYTVKRDEAPLFNTLANSSGYISFSNSEWSEHTFEIEEYTPSSTTSATGWASLQENAGKIWSSGIGLIVVLVVVSILVLIILNLMGEISPKTTLMLLILFGIVLLTLAIIVELTPGIMSAMEI